MPKLLCYIEFYLIFLYTNHYLRLSCTSAAVECCPWCKNKNKLASILRTFFLCWISRTNATNVFSIWSFNLTVLMHSFTFSSKYLKDDIFVKKKNSFCSHCVVPPTGQTLFYMNFECWVWGWLQQHLYFSCSVIKIILYINEIK